MAAKISFKQQCPSCEAMVPIRDPKLVGRKIDCPKCKYRFVVEEPVEEEDEDEEEGPAKKKAGITNKKPVNGKAAPRRRDDDDDEDEVRPKKKASGGSSGILIIGIGLAAVAVVALAVGAWLLFGGDKDPKPKPGGGGMASNTPQEGGEVQKEKPPDKTKDKPKPRVEDVTNLLPNDAQMVLNLPLGHLLNNAAGRKAALLAPGAFSAADFQRTWGIPPTEISRIVMGVNAEKNSVFSVMRTARPLKEDQVVAGLKLKAETSIGGMNYYLLKKPLDGLSTFLLKKNEAREQVALHFPDSFTVVCAEPAAVQQFLQEKGQPKRLSQSPSSDAEEANGAAPGAPGAPPGTPGAKPGTPGAPPGAPGAKPGGPPGAPGAKPGGPPGAPGAKPGTPPGAPGGQPGAPPGTPGAPPGAPGAKPGTPGAKPGAPGAKPGAPPPSGVGGFKPPNMPGAPGGLPGKHSGGDGDDTEPAPVSSSYLTVDPHLKAVLDQVEKTDKKEDQVVLFSMAMSSSLLETNAKQVREQHSAPSLLSAFLLRMRLVSFKGDTKAVGFGLANLGEKFSRTLAWESKDEKTVSDIQDKVEDALEKAFDREDLDMLSKDASSKKNSPGTPGGMPPGGFPPQGPGGRPAVPPQPGGRQPPNGSPQSRPGRFPPPGGEGFPPGEGEGEDEKKGKDGDYFVWTKDQVVAASINRKLKAEDIKHAAMTLIELCKAFRARADMTDNRSRLHELAAATQAFLQKEGHFPRGTVARAPDSGRFLDWRPDQRLSWMVPLLEHIDDGRFKKLDIKTDQSWNEGENLHAGATVVPQFLSPLPPDKPEGYYLAYPGVREMPLAATHFVGMAGVGLDAAEYNAKDSATAKLRGIFGYDRETKADEIKDGLAETILLIQVPPRPRSPWIAGGGSTVRGVSSDGDCVQPFVCAEHEGKRGTFAIMADGKVRFIPASIDPKMFQALCTIAGGEKIKDIDDLAPEVPPDEEPIQPELKAELPPKAPPAPQGAAGEQGKDLKDLQGTWSLVGGEVGGQTIPAEFVKQMAGQVVFTGDKYTLKAGKDSEGGVLKLDDTKTPKTVDAQVSEGKDKGKTQLGIYALSGDELKLCFAQSGQPRPEGFKTQAKSANQAFVFKRAKP